MENKFFCYLAPRLALRLLALMLTLMLECAVAWLLGYKSKNEIKAIICVNLITNPILNYVLWVFPWMFQWIWPLEIIVVWVEWFLLRFALKQKAIKLLGLSLAMNAASYFLGMPILNLVRFVLNF